MPWHLLLLVKKCCRTQQPKRQLMWIWSNMAVVPPLCITWLDHVASPFLLWPSWMQQCSMPEHRVLLEFSPLWSSTLSRKWTFSRCQFLATQLHLLRSCAPASPTKDVASFWLHGTITHSARFVATWHQNLVWAFWLAQLVWTGWKNSNFSLPTAACIVRKLFLPLLQN